MASFSLLIENIPRLVEEGKQVFWAQREPAYRVKVQETDTGVRGAGLSAVTQRTFSLQKRKNRTDGLLRLG